MPRKRQGSCNTTFIIKKQVKAPSLVQAIKDENKARIIEVYEHIPDEQPPQDFSPAIGFAVDYNEDDYYEE